jgi:prolyl 4-hydroxylase
MLPYETGERFDLHHDWYDVPQRVAVESGRMFNRIASFRVLLDDRFLGERRRGFLILKGGRICWGLEGAGKWRRYEDGELAFRLRSGSVLLWVILHGMVMHEGLLVSSERKTVVNIWPRRIY